MRADTIRRLLVFGVCALGVSALYLVPGVRTPVATQARNDRPTSAPLAATTTKRVTYETKESPTTARATSQTTTTTTTADPESVAVLDEQPVTAPRTATEEDPPPPPVATINLDRVTADEATISWPKASDGDRVAAYRISLNGFVVETTTKTSATVHWFNDDSEQQFVEIRTVDAAGHVSDRPARLLTRRPEAGPTPTVTAPPDPSTPTPSPEATSSSPAPENSEPSAGPSAKTGAASEAADQSSEPGPTPGS